MKKIALFVFLCFFNAYSSFEFGAFYGRSFNNKIGDFEAKDGGIEHTAGVKADLKNRPNRSNIFGLDAEFIFKEMVGLNLDFRYSKYKIATGDAVLTEGDGSKKTTTFPAFNMQSYSLTPSLILRKQFNQFTPYLGLGYSFTLGIVDNTRFSLDEFYGIGGKKNALFLHGMMLKLGLLYNLTESFKLGLEYSFNDYKIKDTNQEFRSFNKGFDGVFKSHQVVIKLKYSIS